MVLTKHTFRYIASALCVPVLLSFGCAACMNNGDNQHGVSPDPQSRFFSEQLLAQRRAVRSDSHIVNLSARSESEYGKPVDYDNALVSNVIFESGIGQGVDYLNLLTIKDQVERVYAYEVGDRGLLYLSAFNKIKYVSLEGEEGVLGQLFYLSLLPELNEIRLVDTQILHQDAKDLIKMYELGLRKITLDRCEINQATLSLLHSSRLDIVVVNE
jgi:hypothetical protein